MNALSAHTLIPPVIPSHPSLRYHNWLHGFPLRSFLELGAYHPAAASARGHARNVLVEWGLGDFTDAVTLVISELIANSVNATGRVTWEGGVPPVRLWLLGGARAVRDRGGNGRSVGRGPRGSQPAEAGEDDESGRGLGIVDTLERAGSGSVTSG